MNFSHNFIKVFVVVKTNFSRKLIYGEYDGIHNEFHTCRVKIQFLWVAIYQLFRFSPFTGSNDSKTWSWFYKKTKETRTKDVRQTWYWISVAQLFNITQIIIVQSLACHGDYISEVETIELFFPAIEANTESNFELVSGICIVQNRWWIQNTKNSIRTSKLLCWSQSEDSDQKTELQKNN